MTHEDHNRKKAEAYRYLIDLAVRQSAVPPAHLDPRRVKELQVAAEAIRQHRRPGSKPGQYIAVGGDGFYTPPEGSKLCEKCQGDGKVEVELETDADIAAGGGRFVDTRICQPCDGFGLVKL